MVCQFHILNKENQVPTIWLRVMSPPFRVGRHIVFPRASVCLSVRPSVCLCVCHKSCPLHNLKTAQAIFTKLYTNINQHEMTWRVQEWELCLLYFLSYFPLNFVHHKNCVCSISWKPLKLYSRNFIQISISMRWHAECKNGNSAFYTFWVISLWTLCITKMVSAL